MKKITVRVYGRDWYGQRMSCDYPIRRIAEPGEVHYAGEARADEPLAAAIARFLDTNAGDFSRVEAWEAWETDTTTRVLAEAGEIPDDFFEEEEEEEENE